MIGNFLIVLSVVLPMVSSVFAEDYRPLRSEDDLLYNVRFAYVEFHGDSQKRMECQRLRKAGAECRVFRVDYKWVVAISALMIVGGFYLRSRSRSRFILYQRSLVMTHRDGFPRFSARSAWRGDAGHREPRGTPSESLGKPPFRSPGRTAGVRREALTMPRIARGSPPARRIAQAISMGHYLESVRKVHEG